MDMDIKGKNLLDTAKELQGAINYLAQNNQRLVSVEINRHTLDHINLMGVRGFGPACDVEIIINESIPDGCCKMNTEDIVEGGNYGYGCNR